MPKRAATYLYLVIALLIFAGCSPDDTLTTKLQRDEESTVDNTGEQHTQTMTVHFLDVRHADSTLLQFNDEDGTPYTMLIDTGNWNTSDVVSYLKSEQITSIDIIAITHPHADHIGQLDQIIEEFDVTEVWMNGETANSEIFEKALTAIEQYEVDYYEPKSGDIFDIGPLEITIVHPVALSGSTNDNSIAMRLQFDEVSFLFTGDAEKKAEQEMMERDLDLKATILHVGHHGSNTSTTIDFLKHVSPEVAIYSAGRDNRYDHPHEEIIKRIKAEGIVLYGTDMHGTVRIETDGKAYTVQTNGHGIKKTDRDAHAEANEQLFVSTDSCININEAGESEIQQIVHIGPDRAKSLIEERPFESIDQLSNIDGIGPARLKDIKVQGIACLGG